MIKFKFLCISLLFHHAAAFFRTILLNNPHNNPLLFLNGINSIILKLIIDYIYCGEAQLYHEQLDAFLEVAQKLKIEGLLSTNNVVPDDTISKDENNIDDTNVQLFTDNM